MERVPCANISEKQTNKTTSLGEVKIYANYSGFRINLSLWYNEMWECSERRGREIQRMWAEREKEIWVGWKYVGADVGVAALKSYSNDPNTHHYSRVCLKQGSMKSCTEKSHACFLKRSMHLGLLKREWQDRLPSEKREQKRNVCMNKN